MRALGVTGASGYIGRSLLKSCHVAGWAPVVIGRGTPPGASEVRKADLSQPPSRDLLKGLDAIVHLAANTTGAPLPDDAELTFARTLAEACHSAGIPLVFVSSQAAASSTPSGYGRTKAIIEDAILPFGAIIIRPGLVIGGDAAGLFGMMVAVVRNALVLPMLLPRPMIQPVHVDDLSKALLAALDRPRLAGTCLSIAGDLIPFDELLMKIAYHHLRVRRLRIPVPAVLVRSVLMVVSCATGPRLSHERLDSLTGLKEMHCRPDLQRLDVSLRPLEQALDRRSSLRRSLLLEARSLGRATIALPGAGFLRRYAKLLPKLGVPWPLELPAAVLMSPVSVAALDRQFPRGAPFGSLSWRMDMVTRLAECEPAWAGRFIPLPGSAGFLRACFSFLHALCLELQVRAAAPWVRFLSRTSQ